jgi:hypothetical protein
MRLDCCACLGAQGRVGHGCIPVGHEGSATAKGIEAVAGKPLRRVYDPLFSRPLGAQGRADPRVRDWFVASARRVLARREDLPTLAVRGGDSPRYETLPGSPSGSLYCFCSVWWSSRSLRPATFKRRSGCLLDKPAVSRDHGRSREDPASG